MFSFLVGQKEQFLFPPTPKENEKMEMNSIQVDEGYSDKVIKARTRSFDTPKIVNTRKERAGSLDLNVVGPRQDRILERAESWDVEKYSPESKVNEQLTL